MIFVLPSLIPTSFHVLQKVQIQLIVSKTRFLVRSVVSSFIPRLIQNSLTNLFVILKRFVAY